MSRKITDMKYVDSGELNAEVVNELLQRVKHHNVSVCFNHEPVPKEELEQYLHYLRFSGKLTDEIHFHITESESEHVIAYFISNMRMRTLLFVALTGKVDS